MEYAVSASSAAHMACPQWDSLVHSSLYAVQQLRLLRHHGFRSAIFPIYAYFAGRRIDLAFDTSSGTLTRVTVATAGLEGSEGITMICTTRVRVPPYPRVESLTIPILVVRYLSTV